jgi:hypothetical protein
MAAKRAFPKTESDIVFGQSRKQPKMFPAGLYARVSTADSGEGERYSGGKPNSIPG